MAHRDNERPDPSVDAAKIRAFFVRRDWARQGLGTMVIYAREKAAIEAGIARLEMTATLTGVKFYENQGYERREKFEVLLANVGADSHVI